jgi:protein-S-isoprenylcysteine O-methyltransferase Ste14
MFPVLVWMYARLARAEEADSKSRFGEAWDRYAETVPAFIPHLRSRLVSSKR